MKTKAVRRRNKYDILIISKYLKEIAEFKYYDENRREQSLLQQSSQMQTAFAFITAAIYMLLPVIISKRGDITLTFIFIAVAVITIFLLVSLITASLAQWRYKMEVFPNIEDVDSLVKSQYKMFLTREEQLTEYNHLFSKAQKSKFIRNGIRVKLITYSMISFYISISFIVIFFIHAVIILA